MSNQAQYENLSDRIPILGPDRDKPEAERPFLAMCTLAAPNTTERDFGNGPLDFWQVNVHDRASYTGALPAPASVIRTVAETPGILHLLPDDHALGEPIRKLGMGEVFVLHYAGTRKGKRPQPFKDWRVYRVS